MKKRLLFLNGHLNPGGVEKALVDILRHLDYSKYEVDLILFEGYGAYLDQVPAEVNVRLVDLCNTYGSVISSISRCVKQRDWLCFRMRLIFLLEKFFGAKVLRLARKTVFRKKEYDVAIGFRSGLCTDLVAYGADSAKKITWWHHGEYNLSEVASKEYQETCRQMSHIVAVSEGCAHFLKEHHPELTDKIIVIPNIVPVDEIRAQAEEFQPYLSENKWKIVSVGRLSPEKHMEDCVYAARYLIDRGISDFTWYIVGDGAERKRIEALVKEQGVDDYIVLAGSQRNPYPYMKNADLFVHPSYVESQGLVVLEAMALGVPCVVTKSIGPCEFIQDKTNGVLTERNIESLTQRIAWLMSDNTFYEQIRSNSVCPIRFSSNVIIGYLEKLLLE